MIASHAASRISRACGWFPGRNRTADEGIECAAGIDSSSIVIQLMIVAVLIFDKIVCPIT